MTENHQLLRMRMELRRGILVLAVLAALRQEQYGYSLRKELIKFDIDIEEGTLYPLITRLESYDLLQSEWRLNDSRKKKYYKISPQGEALLVELTDEWHQMVGSINKILGQNT